MRFNTRTVMATSVTGRTSVRDRRVAASSVGSEFAAGHADPQGMKLGVLCCRVVSTEVGRSFVPASPSALMSVVNVPSKAPRRNLKAVLDQLLVPGNPRPVLTAHDLTISGSSNTTK
jgi:hypothetical protein